MSTSVIGTEARWRHFFRHAAEMVVAMLVGMALADQLVGTPQRPDVAAFVAATGMTVAMTVWMLHRGHGWARVVEMAAAMYLPYLVLLVPHWLGFLPGEHVVMGGHVLMLPAMAFAMLAHREEYSRHHSGTAHPLVRVLAHRAPTWIALAMVGDNWQSPSAPEPWTLLLLPSAYLFFGVVRGQFADRRMLAVQVAGFALYLALAVLAANVEWSLWVVAAGWGLHAVWDFAHHRADRVAPRWWSEWCGVVDLVIAATIVLFLV
ncbi:hypothetical protein FKR81_16055 [Lentzea tibetensis]|uniref:Uncharacterized protein n=1 Tax=Lentzea tibetensis TaxID=2591470 RepID=A0A563EUC7_9PSEU|nr:hypothetical protein [Lentzea tibetensis]TWP51138.1 hypothetical protein FKR81_16055 [Lentzea tibetensis]